MADRTWRKASASGDGSWSGLRAGTDPPGALDAAGPSAGPEGAASA